MRKFMKIGMAGLVAGFLLVAAPAAFGAVKAPTAPQAKITTGTCSQGSTWKLTLKWDAGRIEADIEVQTNVAGHLWRFRMFDNGVKFGAGHKTTATDGSWSATRFAANQPGLDNILVKARDTVNGETCQATGSF